MSFDLRYLDTIPDETNLLCRNNIAAAKLAGLIDDLNLSSTEFSVSTTLIIASSSVAMLTTTE